MVLRALWLVCALLQVGLRGTVALADALEDGAPAGAAIPHFEAHSTESCPHAHGPDAFCQFLNAPFSVTEPIGVMLGDGRTVAESLAVAAAFVVAAQVPHPPSRAPPHLS